MPNFPIPAWTLECTDSDMDLVTAHCAGDSYAFVVLMARHQHRINAVAARMCGINDRADVVQETAVRIWRALGTFRGECSLATWIHRIAVNVCLDRLRATPPVVPTETTEWADPTDEYRVVDLRRTVVAALRRLPDEQRMAIVLVDIRGWSVDEAAAQLECPVGTIKSRCARGRAKLAQILSEPVT